MIFRILTIVIFFAAFLVLGGNVNAQQSESDELRTRVGNPTVEAASCPIPGGTPSCGSKNVPRAGCGHCSASYTENWGCGYHSLQFALDVPAAHGSDIILPSIDGNPIRWTWWDQPKNVGNTAIQRYGGTNEETGEQYMIKFHHSAPGSGGGTKYSGEVGARICDAPCEVGSGPHVHIEFARVRNDGSYQWLEAPRYFCGG